MIIVHKLIAIPRLKVYNSQSDLAKSISRCIVFGLDKLSIDIGVKCSWGNRGPGITV